MPYLLILVPATGLVVGGYFVLFLSNRSEGALKTFGKFLGFWCFALSALLVLGTIFFAIERGGNRDRVRDRIFLRGGPGMMMGQPGMMGQGGIGPGLMMPVPQGAAPFNVPVPPPGAAPNGAEPVPQATAPAPAE